MLTWIQHNNVRTMPALNTYRVFPELRLERCTSNTRIHFIPCNVPFKASSSDDVVNGGLVAGADTDSNTQYKERDRALSKPRISRHDFARVLFCAHDEEMVTPHGFVTKMQKTSPRATDARLLVSKVRDHLSVLCDKN